MRKIAKQHLTFCLELVVCNLFYSTASCRGTTGNSKFAGCDNELLINLHNLDFESADDETKKDSHDSEKYNPVITCA